MELQNSPAASPPLYDSVAFLPFSQDASECYSPPPQSSSPIGPYTVFRNEISVSTVGGVGSPSSLSQDFFSLDLKDEGNPQSPLALAPLSYERSKEKKLVPDLELESAWFSGNKKFKSPMLQLHNEIVDFAEFLSPTSEEEALRKTAVDRVINVVKNVWPHCKVDVFGSFRTGLYLPTSDIDIVILESGINNPQMGLRALSKALTRKGVAKQIRVIAKARVPIIKFVEKLSNIAFDLSFDLENGPIAADYIKDVVCNWPSLKPLCLVLKVFLQQRELNEVFTGGVGSYALLTMLMTMLKSLSRPEAPLEQNLGILLVRFFDFYGRKLNNEVVGISCRGGETFFSKRRKGFMNEGRPSLIAIEDPQNPENDIGKNSYNYFQIRSAFLMAYSTLTNPKVVLGLNPKRSILGTIIRPDAVLLRRKGGSDGQMTLKTVLSGAGEPLDGVHGQMQMVGNWSFDDDYDALPRGGGDSAAKLPGSKRKAKNSRKRSDDLF